MYEEVTDKYILMRVLRIDKEKFNSEKIKYQAKDGKELSDDDFFTVIFNAYLQQSETIV